MSDTYCNNCGKHGHNYNQCKLPITSLGLITYRINNNKIEYLMICRKDTLGFVDFMRGKYSTNNKSYIMNMLIQMTSFEKKILLEKSFDELWSYIWGDVCISNQYKSEENISKTKFNTLRNGIKFKNKQFNLNDLIEESNKFKIWNEPEWGFPKGRRNLYEKDIDCAKREFEEESGVNKATVISNGHKVSSRGAALANGAKPTTRKADIRMANRRRISFDSFLELLTNEQVVTHLS